MATATVSDVHAHRDVHLSMTEVNALFDSEKSANEAIRALGAARFHVEDATVWEPGQHQFWEMDDRLGKDARWAGIEALIAGSLGAGIMAAVTGIVAAERMGAWPAVLLGAMLGFGFGGLLGAMFGLQLADPPDDDPLVTVTPETGQVALTFVSARPVRARRLVRKMGGRLVTEPGHNLPVTS